MNKKQMALAAVGLASLTFVGVSEALAGCAGNWPLRWEMPLKSSHVGKSISEVFNQSGFFRAGSLRNSDNRLSFANAPGGGTAIRMNVRKGENKIVSFQLSPLGKPGAEKACLTLDVYLSSNFDWATAGTKLGFGLWGGETTSDNSGGIPPQLQEGWSLRNVNNYRGVRAYSYHLNRSGSTGSASKCDPYKCLYGQTFGSHVPLRAGQWNKVEMEVQMNIIGSTNGSLKMWVNGTQVASKTGLQWRKKSSWAIQGLKFTDMWGGNTSDTKNFSPKAQEIFYKNYRLYASSGSGGTTSDGGGTSGSGGGDTGGTTSGDGFAPIYPSAGSTVEPLKQIVWSKHPQADRYYIKIVDPAKVIKLQEKYSLSQISCDSADVCKVPYGGSTLKDGKHSMILRAVRSGSKLQEYKVYFTVAGGGGGYTGGSGSGDSGSDGGGSTSGGGSGDDGSSGDGGSTGTSSGPVTAKAPIGTISDNTPTFVWTSDSVDRYYLRAVDDNGNTMFTQKLSPTAAKCASDSLCEYTSASLKDGKYRWWVRGIYDGVKGPDSKVSFEIR